MQKRKNDDNKPEAQPASKQFKYSNFVSAGKSSAADNKEEVSKGRDSNQLIAAPTQQQTYDMPVVSST